MILLWILLGCAVWSFVWLAYYFLIGKKHDASGDGGIAIPYVILSEAWDRFKRTLEP